MTPRPGHSERSAFALGAHSLDIGAGTWARDVLCPERRQAGRAGPAFHPYAWLRGRRVGSHSTPLAAERGMLGRHAPPVRGSQQELTLGLNDSAESQQGCRDSIWLIL